jgi:hypothetical protein
MDFGERESDTFMERMPRLTIGNRVLIFPTQSKATQEQVM